MTDKKRKHGGKREGAGRTPLADDDITVVLTAKVTAGQKAKFQALGGAAWLREQIEKAKL